MVEAVAPEKEKSIEETIDDIGRKASEQPPEEEAPQPPAVKPGDEPELYVERIAWYVEYRWEEDLDFADDAGDYIAADVPKQIAQELRRLPQLSHLQGLSISYVYRNKEKWTSGGVPVLGKTTSITGLHKYHSRQDYAVQINLTKWKALNAMQKVALIFHHLMRCQKGGSGKRPYDFRGYFEEVELFGTGTWMDWRRLERAAIEAGYREHQYTLPLEVTPDESADED